MEAQRETLFEALPRHVKPDQMVRAALTSLRRNPRLLDCTPESFFGSLAEAGALGLVPDGVLGHAYLIPFKDECTFVAGYKGFINLARRSGDVSTLVMEAVYEGDEFSYGLGDDPFIKHVPNDSDPHRTSKPVSHVYVVVGLKDGGKQRKVWSRGQVDAHKEQYSRAWNKADSAWKTNWVAMAKKTVLRDMVNRGELPVSVELQRLAAREEQYEVAQSAPRGVAPDPGVARVDSLFDRLTAPPEAEEPKAEEPAYNPPTIGDLADGKPQTETGPSTPPGAADSGHDPAAVPRPPKAAPRENEQLGESGQLFPLTPSEAAINEDAEPTSDQQMVAFLKRIGDGPATEAFCDALQSEIEADPWVNATHHNLLREALRRKLSVQTPKRGRKPTKEQS